MELDFDKYTKVKKVKAPNSERAEQIQKVVEITGKPFKQIAGLTKHLQPDVMYRLFQEANGNPAFWWTKLREKYMDKEKAKQNKHYIHMKEKMQKFPDMRECSKRIPYLKVIALRNIGLKDAKLVLEKQDEVKIELTYEQLDKYSIEIGTQDRWWRLVQELEEELRGKEYVEKLERMKNKRNELGYR